MDHFPRGSVIRRVNIEPAILFGAGRALLLQLAHPAVAQGVHEHSDFKGNPFKRLQGTLEAMNAVVFGNEELARGVPNQAHGRLLLWQAERHVRQWRAREAASESGRATGSAA